MKNIKIRPQKNKFFIPENYSNCFLNIFQSHYKQIRQIVFGSTRTPCTHSVHEEIYSCKCKFALLSRAEAQLRIYCLISKVNRMHRERARQTDSHRASHYMYSTRSKLQNCTRIVLTQLCNIEILYFSIRLREDIIDKLTRLSRSYIIQNNPNKGMYVFNFIEKIPSIY